LYPKGISIPVIHTLKTVSIKGLGLHTILIFSLTAHLRGITKDFVIVFIKFVELSKVAVIISLLPIKIVMYCLWTTPAGIMDRFNSMLVIKVSPPLEFVIVELTDNPVYPSP